jgi:hypothetical protein
MTLDKFGRSDIKKNKSILRGPQGPPGVGFLLDVNSDDYDMQNKRLINLKKPLGKTDATTKAYVDTQTHTILNELTKLQQYISKFFDGYAKQLKELQNNIDKEAQKIDTYLSTGNFTSGNIHIAPVETRVLDKTIDGKVYE